MAIEGFELCIPSSDVEKKQLRVMIEECVSTMIRADGERDHKKEIIAAIKEQFKIDTSILNKIISMRHKQTFTTVEAKQEATKELYTALFGHTENITDND